MVISVISRGLISRCWSPAIKSGPGLTLTVSTWCSQARAANTRHMTAAHVAPARRKRASGYRKAFFTRMTATPFTLRCASMGTASDPRRVPSALSGANCLGWRQSQFRHEHSFESLTHLNTREQESGSPYTPGPGAPSTCSGQAVHGASTATTHGGTSPPWHRFITAWPSLDFARDRSARPWHPAGRARGSAPTNGDGKRLTLTLRRWPASSCTICS